jgi:hypothetical protein
MSKELGEVTRDEWRRDFQINDQYDAGYWKIK